MLTPHRVLEDAMERGNLPEEERRVLREHFGLAQLLFQLDDMGVDLDELMPDPLGDFEDRDEDVLPAGYYVMHDPEIYSVFTPDDELAFTVTPNTSDHEINHLAWEYEIYGPTPSPAKESA